MEHLSNLFHGPTFKVQILGSIDTLTCRCRVYFQRVSVAVVSGDGHIVPLVVIQCPFTFSLDEIGPISKVKNIVDVSAREKTVTKCFRKRQLSAFQTTLRNVC